MDEGTSAIVKDIFEARQKLGDNLEELQHKVRDAADWRTYFNRNPWMLLAIAAGSGLLLSALLTPRRTK